MAACRLSILPAVLMAAALLVGCSAIKIETGQTQQEAVATSESQARRIRSEWADRLLSASPPEMVQLLVRHVDSVSARYVIYGFHVVDEWQQGNSGRGENVPDDEMRQVVDAWTKNQQPILTAWEDNLEYALQLIKESGFFDTGFLQMLQKLADQYYRVYSTVFYPAGDVERYETALHETQREIETLSDAVKDESARY